MFNVQQITDRLAGMSDPQLQQYAAMHKDDPYILPLAASEFKRRQQTRMAMQAQQGPQGPQPTVADQDLMQMQQAAQPQQMPPQQRLPEQQGIGQLPAQNLATMADGGIVGYAEGGGPRREGMDPEFAKRLNAFEAEYERLYKRKAPITSLVRSRDEQQDIYNEWVRLGGSAKKPTVVSKKHGTISTPTNPAKYPDKQVFHDNAADIELEGVPDALLHHYGLHRPLANDRVHVMPMKNWKPENERAVNQALAAHTKKKIGEMSAAEAAKWKQVQGGFTDAMARASTPIAIPASTLAPTPAPAAQVAAKDSLSENEILVDPMGNVIGGGVPQKQAPIAAEFEQGLKEAGASAANIPDTLWNMLVGAGATGAYGTARASGKGPREAKQVAQSAAADFSSPVGKLFGIENTPEYRNAPTQQAMDWIGRNLAKSATWISKQAKDKFGIDIPVEDVENMQESLLLGAPKVAGAGRTMAGKVARGEFGVKTQLPKRATTELKEAAKLAEEAQKKTEAPRLAFEPEGSKPQIVVNPKGEAVLPKPELVREAAALKERGKAGLAEDIAASERAVKALDEAKARAISEGVVPTRQPVAEVSPALGVAAAGAANASTNPMEGVPEDFVPNAQGVPYSGYETPEMDMPADTRSGAVATPFAIKETAPQPPAAKETVAPQSKKGMFGLTNDDLLMLGLQMMASPGGQSGNALQQLASNLGRSGLATLTARKEQERAEKEDAYKALLGDMYKAQIAQMGKPSAEIQTLQALEKDPALMARYRQVQQAKDYGTTVAGLVSAYNKARMESALLGKDLTWEEFTKGVPRNLWDPTAMPEGVIVNRRQNG